MSPLVDRAAEFLLKQTEPLLMGDVCERIGITRGMATTLARKLRVALGDKLVETSRRDLHRNGLHRRTYYSVVGAAIVSGQGRGLTIPRDLYRGWRNPITGITGARLGVGT